MERDKLHDALFVTAPNPDPLPLPNRSFSEDDEAALAGLLRVLPKQLADKVLS